MNEDVFSDISDEEKYFMSLESSKREKDIQTITLRETMLVKEDEYSIMFNSKIVHLFMGYIYGLKIEEDKIYNLLAEYDNQSMLECKLLEILKSQVKEEEEIIKILNR